MRTIHTLVIASVLGLAAGIAGAQAAAGKGPMGTQPGASVPTRGAGQGAFAVSGQGDHALNGCHGKRQDVGDGRVHEDSRV